VQIIVCGKYIYC